MFTFATPNRFGPLNEGFSFQVNEGLTSLVGLNDSGKSALLQLAFINLFDNGEYGAGRICLLLPERMYVLSSTETGGRSLEQFNTELRTAIGNTLIPYEDYSFGPSRRELPRLLLNHTDYQKQLQILTDYLGKLGMSNLVLRGSQLAHFENIAVQFHGTGLRSLFSILCALTDPEIRVVLIDEPELSLEPKLQKLLSNLLLEVSDKKTIIIATHSHLFLNRKNYSSNYLVTREGEIISVNPISQESQLFDLVFNLLGSSTEDLLFPGNFMIVEGVSDQIIVERILDLLEVDRYKVKIVAASGIGNLKNIISSVENALRPLVMNGSVYSKKVVVLIDKNEDPKVRDLKSLFKKRFFMLNEPSLEEYFPEEFYTRLSRNKGEDIQHIKSIKNNYEELNKFKKALSQQISASLTVEDLNKIPTIVSAVKKAIQ